VLVYYKEDIIIISLNVTCSRNDIAESYEFESRSWRGVVNTTLRDKV